MFYVYILQSKTNKEIYVGSTKDLKRRLQEHNGGMEQSTKRYAPWELLYFEAFRGEKQARMREQRLKQHGNALRALKRRIGLYPAPSSGRSGAGFTLIELLLGMGIFAALITAVIAIQTFLAQGEAFNLATVQTIENANASLQTIVSELRNARLSDAGAYPLELADDQQIIFYSNADSDTQIERVRYFLDGTEFKKGVIDPVGFPATYPPENESTKVIAEHVQNGADPTFYYYNQDWPTDQVNNPLSTPAPLIAVTLVKIQVRVNADPSRPQGEFALEPVVQIRNLKTNL